MEYMTTTAMAVIWETRAGFNLQASRSTAFFRMYLHQDLGSTRWNPSIVLEDGNPPVAMQLQKEKNVANLTVELPRGDQLFGNARALYAFLRPETAPMQPGFSGAGLSHAVCRFR